jgi:acyl carrier protein
LSSGSLRCGAFFGNLGGAREERGSLDAGDGETPRAEVERMAGLLMGVMEREIDGVAVSRDDWGTDSIARLELDSLALIGFLVAVEEEFRIEWDPDVDLDVLRSFDAMASYVLKSGGTPTS